MMEKWQLFNLSEKIILLTEEIWMVGVGGKIYSGRLKVSWYFISQMLQLFINSQTFRKISTGFGY